MNGDYFMSGKKVGNGVWEKLVDVKERLAKIEAILQERDRKQNRHLVLTAAIVGAIAGSVVSGIIISLLRFIP